MIQHIQYGRRLQKKLGKGEFVMATYKEIQTYIKQHHQITVQTCWIAHMKEKLGLPKRVASNRIDENRRVKPCPTEYEGFIEEAFKYFGMI